MSYMLLLSPAKKQEYSPPEFAIKPTKSRLLADTDKLLAKLKKLSISDLAELNYQRYQDYDLKSYTNSNSCPAIYMFYGDVYRAFDVATVAANKVDFLQDHMRILSGLYGVLRPLDKIKYHRLEMGCNFSKIIGEGLHDYWREDVTKLLNKDLLKQINIANNKLKII